MIDDTERELQRIFEFVVKYHEGTILWTNAELRRFIRWAVYFRRLFVVWSDVKNGGRRIIALGTAWRTETPVPNLANLDFEHTEFGNYLFVHQVIVHPDFRNAGTLFQLLSMALWRYPECHTAYWISEHSPSKRVKIVSVYRLIKSLHSQVKLNKLRPFIRRQSWVEERKPPQFPMLQYLQ